MNRQPPIFAPTSTTYRRPLGQATSTQADFPSSSTLSSGMVCAIQGRRGGTCHWTSADRFGLSHQCMTPILATPHLASFSDPAKLLGWTPAKELDWSVVGLSAAVQRAATPPVVFKDQRYGQRQKHEGGSSAIGQDPGLHRISCSSKVPTLALSLSSSRLVNGTRLLQALSLLGIPHASLLLI